MFVASCIMIALIDVLNFWLMISRDDSFMQSLVFYGCYKYKQYALIINIPEQHPDIQDLT